MAYNNTNVLSHSSEPEVQNQGADWALLALKGLGKTPSLPLPGHCGCSNPWQHVACSCVTPIPAVITQLWHLCVCVPLSSMRAPVTALGAQPNQA